MEKRNYNFTLVPTKLMTLLDNKLKSLLFVLLNQYGAFHKENGTYDIVFSYISVFSDISLNEVKIGLDLFQRMGVIEIPNVTEKGCTIIFNYDKIQEFDSLSYKDCLNMENKVRIPIQEECQNVAKTSTRDNLLNSLKGLNY